MQNLKVRSNGSLTALAGFDPRPDHLRNRSEYPAEFRNVCLNSAAENLTIRQLFAPANMCAYQHDYQFYARLSPEEHFLQALGITDLTDSDRQLIEIRTRGQSKNNS
jgi:hypothetical protein